jgi:hypothetical protein
MTKKEVAERDEARETLRGIIKPGQVVYTSLKHVSRSGMQREIALYVVEDGAIRWVTGLAARAMGDRIGKRDGIVVSGCGMDMGFHLVYNLSWTLYPTYKCLGPRVNGQRQCPSTYHSNHHDTVSCWTTAKKDEKHCYWSDALKCHAIETENGSAVRCKRCKGKGRVPNPDGPERFDLEHTDGYALRQEWI